MSREQLEQARQLIIDRDYDAARDILERLPQSRTARKWLANLDGMTEANLTPQWEYLEVFVAFWQQHLGNSEYALSQGENGAVSVDDSYTHLLNQYGEDGWELVNEMVLPSQNTRLLFKRMKRNAD